VRLPGSMVSVPLQSGYFTQDQNGPFLPLRCRVALPHWGHGGPWGTLIDNDVSRYFTINCVTQAACLSMKLSRESWPVSIMSNACSHTAVVPGSAIAAGTVSISVKAASEARMARPFLS